MKRVKNEKCRLTDLYINQLCKVLEINIFDKQLKLRLLEMGLVPNVIIKMKKKAPFRKSYSN